MANGDNAPSVDDLMAQTRAVIAPQQQGPSVDDLMAQTKAIVPPAAAPAATPPETTWQGVGRNIGAGLLDAAGNVINVLSDPLGNLVLHPAAIAGGTAYDFLAPKLGLPQMTPEQRADLYNLPQPGQTQLPPEQQQPGTRAINALDTAIPGQQASNLPASPAEATVRTATGGAGTAAALGPGGILPVIAGGAGAVAAPAIAQNVPEEYRPFVEMATNALLQGAGGAANAKLSASGVDPADAATAQLARDKYNVPIDATDITPGSSFRTPQSVQTKLDAWQGNIVKEMGENPDTPDVLSRNRITSGPGGVMDNTATRVGQVFDDVANRTDINPTETYNAVTRLAGIDHGLDLENLTDAQKAMIRRNIDLVQDAAVNGNGSISGGDYQGLTKTGTPLDKLASNSDPNVAAIGMQIKSAVDDAFQKSASPEDQAALTQARYQWRLMKTVQPLVERAQGANIDPGQFMNRAIAASRKLDGSTGGMAYTGGGNIGELARIGDLISRGPTPTSSSLVGDVFNPAGGGVPFYVNPKLAAAAHVAQVAGKQIAGPYLRSGFNAQQVINNALNPPTVLGGFTRGLVPGLAVGGNPLQQRLPSPP